MKNRSSIKLYLGVLPLVLFAVAFLASCKKDNEMDGPPVIHNVYVLDTVARHRDSLITAAEPFTLLVLNGDRLSGVRKVYFNEYEATFNTVYNTSTKLIIRVPSDAPTDETATNQIRLVTARGEATYNFKIIAKPSISSVDKIVFGSGRGDITIRGKNFADMVQVVAFREKETPSEMVKDSVVCEIISKTEDKLVVRIPENNLSRITLSYTNSSGTVAGTNVLYNADEAFHLFDDDFGTISNEDGTGKFSGDSWGNPVVVSSDVVFGGEKSMSMKLDEGGWKWFGMTSWWPRFRYDPKYKYVIFAIRGGANDMSLWITSDATKAGFAEFPDKNKIDILKNTWNFYRLEISTLDFMYDSTTPIPRIGFRPKGPDKSDTIYIDDFMLVR